METEDILRQSKYNHVGSSTGCCLSAEPDIRLQNDSKKAIPIISNFSKTTDSFHKFLLKFQTTVKVRDFQGQLLWDRTRD